MVDFNETWVQAGGDVVNIKDMATQHIVNASASCVSNIKEFKRTGTCYRPLNSHECRLLDWFEAKNALLQEELKARTLDNINRIRNSYGACYTLDEAQDVGQMRKDILFLLHKLDGE